MSIFLISKGTYAGLKIDLTEWKRVVPVNIEKKLSFGDVFTFYIENRGNDELFAKLIIKYTTNSGGYSFSRNFNGTDLTIMGNAIKNTLEELNLCRNCDELANQQDICNSCEVSMDWAWP